MKTIFSKILQGFLELDQNNTGLDIFADNIVEASVQIYLTIT